MRVCFTPCLATNDNFLTKMAKFVLAGIVFSLSPHTETFKFVINNRP